MLVLDGAMFTLRTALGVTAAAVHEAYLAAGADIISSDTFSAVTAAGNAEAARAARAAADRWTRATPRRPRFVAGVLNPHPHMALPPAARRARLEARIGGLIDGGADLLLAETLASLAEVTAVCEAADAVASAPPLMLSVAVRGGRLLSGESLVDLVELLAPSPPYSVGVNCGEGTAGVRASLELLARRLSCRVSCHPSAGLPDAFGTYDEPPAVTSASLAAAAADGLLSIAGGCCGTTPGHIAALAAAVGDLPDKMAGFRE